MHAIQELIDIALKEDIGAGDVTTEAIVEEDLTGEGQIIAKESLVLAGLNVAKSVFSTLDAEAVFRHDHTDGDRLDPGDLILTVSGRLASLLKGERTALNFLQHLSGIATLTREYTNALQGLRARIVDTRKTLPGFRTLEKYAVRVGGGSNHRMGLYDGVLIKDNHIAACGGIAQAIAKARQRIPHLMKIEVEVADQAGVDEALAAGADIIMLDNMDVMQVKVAVARIKGNALSEASGRVRIDSLRRLAETGVDLISIGALTHSARSVDISMDIKA